MIAIKGEEIEKIKTGGKKEMMQKNVGCSKNKKGERVNNLLIKVSGDLLEDKQTLRFIKEKGERNYVVVLCGGGTEITKQLETAGIEFEFGPSGRITNFEGRQIARGILERQQAELQDLFIRKKIDAAIEIPVISIGGVLCHVNGDAYLRNIGYNTFDELYCITTQERKEKKEKNFNEYPKIKVVGI